MRVKKWSEEVQAQVQRVVGDNRASWRQTIEWARRKMEEGEGDSLQQGRRRMREVTQKIRELFRASLDYQQPPKKDEVSREQDGQRRRSNGEGVEHRELLPVRKTRAEASIERQSQGKSVAVETGQSGAPRSHPSDDRRSHRRTGESVGRRLRPTSASLLRDSNPAAGALTQSQSWDQCEEKLNIILDEVRKLTQGGGPAQTDRYSTQNRNDCRELDPPLAEPFRQRHVRCLISRRTLFGNDLGEWARNVKAIVDCKNEDGHHHPDFVLACRKEWYGSGGDYFQYFLAFAGSESMLKLLPTINSDSSRYTTDSFIAGLIVGSVPEAAMIAPLLQRDGQVQMSLGWGLLRVLTGGSATLCLRQLF
ncbi:uncharacterized protein BKCO1_3800033 [Diplodia corticola]|uniref:Uncharacterized protein n=1 Tax=Diplodia corticola TaxID=236234 RepID=A0A1J9RX30_9PEZI|nr:uncharacterized protein BKCO1_3800033 [Diplodia corticola]OJD32396.1 hypothetical protein BKCO1_3800033 [Diplodia corticola]